MRRFESRDDDTRGHPNWNSDYKDGRFKWKATSEQCGKGAKRNIRRRGKKEEEQAHKEEEGKKGEKGKKEEEQAHKEEEGKKGEKGKKEEDTNPPSPLDIQLSSALEIQLPSPLDIKPPSPLDIQLPSPLNVQSISLLDIQPLSSLVTTIADSCPPPPLIQWWKQELRQKAATRPSLKLCTGSMIFTFQLLSAVAVSCLPESCCGQQGVVFCNALWGCPDPELHWSCISTVGCCPGHVKVYNSLYLFPSSSAQFARFVTLCKHGSPHSWYKWWISRHSQEEMTVDFRHCNFVCTLLWKGSLWNWI